MLLVFIVLLLFLFFVVVDVVLMDLMESEMLFCVMEVVFFDWDWCVESFDFCGGLWLGLECKLVVDVGVVCMYVMWLDFGVEFNLMCKDLVFFFFEVFILLYV